MPVIAITKGSHHLNTAVTRDNPEPPRQFAHIWDFNDPEDNAHQATNFIQYAQALGDFEGPVEILSVNIPDDDSDRTWAAAQMYQWRSIVRAALGVPVEIR